MFLYHPHSSFWKNTQEANDRGCLWREALEAEEWGALQEFAYADKNLYFSRWESELCSLLWTRTELWTIPDQPSFPILKAPVSLP